MECSQKGSRVNKKRGANGDREERVERTDIARIQASGVRRQVDDDGGNQGGWM